MFYYKYLSIFFNLILSYNMSLETKHRTRSWLNVLFNSYKVPNKRARDELYETCEVYTLQIISYKNVNNIEYM